MGHRRCEVCGIQEGRLTGNKLLFSKFPLNLNRCREWLKAVGNEELVHLPIEKLHEQRNVCANHFKKQDFNKNGNRLKKQANPTLNLLASPLTDEQLAEFPQHMYGHSESKGPMKGQIRTCIMCGSSNENPAITLHRFPKPGRKNYLRCELWAKFCFPHGKWSSSNFQMKLYKKHRMLCHTHFKESSYVDFNAKILRRNAAPEENFVQVRVPVPIFQWLLF